MEHQGYDAVKLEHVKRESALLGRTPLRAKSEAADALSAKCLATLTTPERVAGLGRPCHMVESNTTVTVKDVGLQTLLFQFGKYLLLGSSRIGTQPANLVGIWAEGVNSPWAGDYHININFQMMYWAAEALQLREAVEPVTAFIHELARSGASTARCMYGLTGWVAHGFTDIWMKTRALGDPMWAMCPTCGAWAALQLNEGMRFRRNMDELRRSVLPIFAGAVEFFAGTTSNPGYLYPGGPNASLVTGPAHSPENSYFSKGKHWQVTMGPAMDTAIVYELLSAYVDGCIQAGCLSGEMEELHCLETRCRELAMHANMTRSRLVNGGFSLVDEDGFLEEYLRWHASESIVPEDHGHRHWSPLFALYPGDQIHPHQTPALAAAARKMLKRKMDFGGGHTGWSAAWAGALYARLGDGEGVQKMLDRILSRFAMGNLLSTHPPLRSNNIQDCATCVTESPLPADERYWGEKGGSTNNFIATDESKFQLDGNLGTLALVTESLVQSRDRSCACTLRRTSWAQERGWQPPSSAPPPVVSAVRKKPFSGAKIGLVGLDKFGEPLPKIGMPHGIQGLLSPVNRHRHASDNSTFRLSTNLSTPHLSWSKKQLQKLSRATSMKKDMARARAVEQFSALANVTGVENVGPIAAVPRPVPSAERLAVKARRRKLHGAEKVSPQPTLPLTEPPSAPSPPKQADNRTAPSPPKHGKNRNHNNTSFVSRLCMHVYSVLTRNVPHVNMRHMTTSALTSTHASQRICNTRVSAASAVLISVKWSCCLLFQPIGTVAVLAA